VAGCAKAAQDLRAAVIDRAVPLTEYAWKFRYPGEPSEPSADETDEALAGCAPDVEGDRGPGP
jgi:hypothetical protein